jgi:putative chitinase
MTPILFQAMVGCVATVASTWSGPIDDAMRKWEVATPMRKAMFMAQMMAESGNFTRFEEGLRYSAKRLAEVWPRRFAVDHRAAIKVPNAKAFQLANNPEALANHVYADRMGNGPAESGDGFKYRGRGPKQITGLDNYTALSAATGVDYVSNPDLLLIPKDGANAAGWYWSMSGCGPLADALNFVGVTKAINGGLIGYKEQRVPALIKCCRVLGIAVPPGLTT